MITLSVKSTLRIKIAWSGVQTGPKIVYCIQSRLVNYKCNRDYNAKSKINVSYSFMLHCLGAVLNFFLHFGIQQPQTSMYFIIIIDVRPKEKYLAIVKS